MSIKKVDKASEKPRLLDKNEKTPSVPENGFLVARKRWIKQKYMYYRTN